MVYEIIDCEVVMRHGSFLNCQEEIIEFLSFGVFGYLSMISTSHSISNRVKPGHETTALREKFDSMKFSPMIPFPLDYGSTVGSLGMSLTPSIVGMKNLE